MKHRPPHILGASTDLLGICFIIITGLRLVNADARSIADEVAWLAAALLFVAAMTAYLAIRGNHDDGWHIHVADAAFLSGMTVLAAAVVIAAVSL